MIVRFISIVVLGCILLTRPSNAQGQSPTGDELRTLAIPDDAVEVERAYRPMGDVAKRCQYLLDGELVGERLYYSNGQIADEKLFRKKQLHGIWRQFYQDGSLFSERPYRDGLPHGTFRFWNDRGELLGASELKDGNGLLQSYEKSDLGSYREEVRFAKGKIHGIRKRWGRFDITDKNGCDVTTFRHGVKDGWSYTLHDDGTLLAYSYFKNDRLHGVMRRTNRDGSNVEGYPKYRVEGREVTEAQFREAAKTDDILALTLTGKPEVEESDSKPTKQADK